VLVASACTRYVDMSIELAVQSDPGSDLVLRILDGVHGMHGYAMSNWLEHILDVAKLSGCQYLQDQNATFSTLIYSVYQRVIAAHERCFPGYSVQGHHAGPTVTDQRLAAFAPCPPLELMAAQIWEGQRSQVSNVTSKCLKLSSSTVDAHDCESITALFHHRSSLRPSDFDI
jgi:hypothetical protein